MAHRRLAVTFLVLALAVPASAGLIPGGSAKSDCYLELDVLGVENPSEDVLNNRVVTCADGDACDIGEDGDDRCTMQVAPCINQTDPNLPDCTPPANLDSVKFMGAVVIPEPPALDGPRCEDFVDVEVPVKITRSGQKKPGKVRIRGKATAPRGTRPRRDPDAWTFKCLPQSAATTCPPNPAGGPSQLILTTVRDGVGGDLDNGWNGISHNFPLVGDSILSFCLGNCGGSDTECDGTGPTGEGTTNGAAFGAPLPLLVAATSVCVVNRFDGPLTASRANYVTGEVNAAVKLLSDVYLTTNVPNNGRGQVCPQCSGSAIGESGRCIGGLDDGRPCVVEGSTRVELSTGNKDYRLSRSCRPTGKIATLTIALDPFTTGTASMTGSRPCVFDGRRQLRDNGCASGATCSAQCSGNACVDMVPDVTNPGGPLVCKELKGGISQLCCSNNTELPCHPTDAASGGVLERTGRPAPPVSESSGQTFPASSDLALVSVFCEDRTTNGPIDFTTTGLPGTAALIQPMTGRWLP
jgi:hypothetical protein